MLNAGYVCNKCNMNVEDVQVRERAENENIINYVHYIGNTCGRDHNIRSPMCSARQLDIKVPMTANGIGFAGRELTAEEKQDLERKLK